MIIFIISVLATAIVSWLLGLFVFLKNRTSKTNIFFFAMCVSIGVWSMGLYLKVSVEDKFLALLGSRLSHLGSIFIPIFFIGFLFNLIDVYKYQKKIFLFIYIYIFLFIPFLFTQFFIKDLQSKVSFKYWEMPGILYPLFILYYLFTLGYGYFVVVRYYRRVQSYKQRQLKYVVVGSIIGFGGGVTTFLPVFDIPIFPWGEYFVILYTVLAAYAITRHRLMDIEVVIKKSLVFAGTFSFVMGVVVVVAFLVGQFLGGGKVFSLVISAFIITLSLRPLENFLTDITNRYLFQKKHPYKEIIQSFTEEVITVLDLSRIVNSTLELLNKTLYPEAVSIFIYNKTQDRYELYSSSGLDNPQTFFTNQNLLIQYLKTTKEPLFLKVSSFVFNPSMEKIINLLKRRKDYHLIREIIKFQEVDPLLKRELFSLKAVLVFGFILHEDLIGFITLGKKKSDEDYTLEDIDVLKALVRTETIAIANAQLLSEAAQSERRAAIGTMAAGIHHEVGNPLNIINTRIQLFFLKDKKGMFIDKSRKEILEECKGILKETLTQTNRISEITKKLANFAKPTREIKPEPVNVKEEIEETLQILGHELELERIHIDKQIEEDLPSLLADRRQIQQIFFNLLKNAGQAIEGEGKITIRAYSNKNGRIRIEVIDTGKGIPQDKLPRIFEPFFTTKAPGKGTGLGLSIVRQLVWRNKGEISVRSKVGEGTTFIIEFVAS